MHKILVRAPRKLAHKLEEILRHHYDVRIEIREETICEIEAKIARNWITICRFAPDENLKDILTMFKVNFELKSRR